MLPAPWRPSDTPSLRGAALPAVVGACVAWFAHLHAPTILVDAPLCGGLATASAAAGVRLLPFAPIGQWLFVLDGLILAMATAAFTLAGWRLAPHRLVVPGLTLGLLFVWTRESGLSGVPSLGLLAGVLTTAGVFSSSGRSALLGLLTSAILWPTSSLMLAVWWAMYSTGGRARLIGGGLIAGLGVAGLALSGSLRASCLVPASPGVMLMAGLGDAAGNSGPYLLGLATLAFVANRVALTRGAYVAAFAMIVTVSDAGRTTMSPTIVVAVWLSAVAGLHRLVQTCRPSIAGRLAATALILVVPALHWQDWAFVRARAIPVSLGHERLSLAKFETALGTLPSNAVFVEEDALTDLLLRAARRRGSPDVFRQASSLTLALTALAPTVIAMPRAQAAIQDLGVVLTAPSGAAPGFAQVSRGGECRAVTEPWRALADLTGAPALSIVARAPAELGPVVVYLTFDARPDIQALRWATPHTRGLYFSIYSTDSAADMTQLADDRRGDGLVAEWPEGAAFVARLELWRPPGAPMTLSASLGATPQWAMGRIGEQASERRLLICPVFPRDVIGFKP